MKYSLKELNRFILTERFILNEAGASPILDLATEIRWQFIALTKKIVEFINEENQRNFITQLKDLASDINDLTDDQTEELKTLLQNYCELTDKLLKLHFETDLEAKAGSSESTAFDNAIRDLKHILSTKGWEGATITDAKTKFSTISTTIHTYFSDYEDKNITNEIHKMLELAIKFIDGRLGTKTPAADEEYSLYLVDKQVGDAAHYNDPAFSILGSKEPTLKVDYKNNLTSLKGYLGSVVGTQSSPLNLPLTDYASYRTTIKDTNGLLNTIQAEATKILKIYELNASEREIKNVFSWDRAYRICITSDAKDKFWNGNPSAIEPELRNGFLKTTFGPDAPKATAIGDQLLGDIAELGFNVETNALLAFMKYAFVQDLGITTDTYILLHNMLARKWIDSEDLRGKGFFTTGNIIFRPQFWKKSIEEMELYLNYQYQFKTQRGSLSDKHSEAIKNAGAPKLYISNIMLEGGNTVDFDDDTIEGSLNTAEFRPTAQVAAILNKLINLDKNVEKAAIKATEIDAILADAKLADKNTVKKVLVYLTDTWYADYVDLLDKLNTDVCGNSLYKLADAYHASAAEKVVYRDLFKLRSVKYTKAQIKDIITKLWAKSI